MSSQTIKIIVGLFVIFCVCSQSCKGLEKLCGKALPDTLDLICTNGFSRKTRKTLDPMEYYDEESEVDLPSLLEELPFLSKIANNALTKTRRRRHGVYDECCRKPCTMSELKTYCL